MSKIEIDNDKIVQGHKFRNINYTAFKYQGIFYGNLRIYEIGVFA